MTEAEVLTFLTEAFSVLTARRSTSLHGFYMVPLGRYYTSARSKLLFLQLSSSCEWYDTALPDKLCSD